MTAQHTPNLFERLFSSFDGWLRYRRELSELHALNGADFDRIAGELQVAPADLDDLVRRGPHATAQLPKLLTALGIDLDALARAEPLVLRDMERVCALCEEKGRCVRDLSAGSSAAQYAHYCRNAPTIGALG
jgi:hypothetical protein